MRAKRIAFIDDIIKGLVCLPVLYMPVSTCHRTMGLIPLKVPWLPSIVIDNNRY